ncbi:MAG: QueT transporter family protein [Clostridia bacterium]|nr:QueT transporter family protein [Clostridia bacterium]
MKTNKDRVLNLTRAAMIGALYFILTWISELMGLARLTPQIRLGEALCILTWFTPSAVPGLFVGCLLANLTMGSVVWDVIFGSLATLIGAFIGSRLKCKWLVPLPTVLANTLIIPFIILYCYMDTVSLELYTVSALGVLFGELVSAYVLGMILLIALDKRKLLK